MSTSTMNTQNNVIANTSGGAESKQGNVPAAPFRSAALYVGDLHKEVSEATLFEIFNAVAPIASVRVCRHAITRQSLGYAYVNFHSVRDAERVLDIMNYTLIKGKMCRIMWSQRDPTLRRSGEGNIFIKNLHKDIDSKVLFDTFSIFGNIVSCKVVTDDEGNSKGFGFVHFETKEAAKSAIEKVNGNAINKQVVYVSQFVNDTRRNAARKWTNLYVKNIPKNWSEEDLAKRFETCGKIASLLIKKDPEGKSKGFGFVDYEEHESAKDAVEKIDGTEVPIPAEEIAEMKKKRAERRAAKAAAAAAESAEDAKGDTKKAETAASTDDKDEDEESYPTTRKLVVCRFLKKRERLKMIAEKAARDKQERIKEFIGKNLYVRNLVDSVTEEALIERFKEFGTVKSCRIMKDENGRLKGFGFLCMSERDEANRALQSMNNVMFMGKPLFVALWQPKEDRAQFLQRKHMMQRGGMNMPNMMLRGAFPQGMMPRGMPMRNGPRGPMMPGPRGPVMYPGMVPGNMMMRGMPRGPMMPGPRGPMMPPMGNNAMPEGGAAPMPAAGMGGEVPQNVPLTAATLASASIEQRKNMIGERLYPLIFQRNPQLAGKVTGMLLDGMDDTDLLHLLESEADLNEKIREALDVLNEAIQQ